MTNVRDNIHGISRREKKGVTAAEVTTTVNAAIAARPAATTTVVVGNTANASDRARANHTGTQLAATVSDFSAAADARIGAAVINALADVVITTPSNGQALKYDGTNWTNQASGGGAAWGGITGTLSAQTDLQGELNLKANLASPTFTGTVGGITKSMVGLANVDNTSDVNKPVSTAQATADALKADLTGATFTGDITIYRSGTPTTGMLFLNSANTRYLFYDGSNYVMPSAALWVNGSPVWTSGNFDPALKANLASPTFTGVINFPSIVFNNGGLYMQDTTGRVRSSGSVAAFSLQARDAGAEWVWYSPTSSPLRLNHSTGGDLLTISSGSVCTAVQFTSTSDARLKDSVQPLKARGQLRPVTFRWNDQAPITAGQVDIGFIAQEVAALYPECVYEGDEGMLQLAYPKLVVALSAEVNALRRDLAELRRLVNALAHP